MRRNAPVGVVRPPRWRGWVISGGWRRRGSGRRRRLSAAEPGSGQGSDGRRCGRSRAQQVGRLWCAAHRQLLRFGSAAARSASIHATTRVQPTRATRTTVSPRRAGEGQLPWGAVCTEHTAGRHGVPSRLSPLRSPTAGYPGYGPLSAPLIGVPFNVWVAGTASARPRIKQGPDHRGMRAAGVERLRAAQISVRVEEPI
jgi:hypothetical protein